MNKSSNDWSNESILVKNKEREEKRQKGRKIDKSHIDTSRDQISNNRNPLYLYLELLKVMIYKHLPNPYDERDAFLASYLIGYGDLFSSSACCELNIYIVWLLR